MPKVGKKHFSYTAAGKAAAEKEAKKTGKKVVMGKGKATSAKGKGTSAKTRRNNMDY